MNVHKNAVLTPRGREQLVERLQAGESKASAAAAVGVSRQTARKWERRMAEEGAAGLEDRSSRPHRSPTQVRRVRERQIARLRRKRWTQAAIAEALGMALSTVGAVCRRLGLGRLPEFERRPPIVRYERERAGEMIHLDIKKLARIERVVAGPAVQRRMRYGALQVAPLVLGHGRIGDRGDRVPVAVLQGRELGWRSSGVERHGIDEVDAA